MASYSANTALEQFKKFVEVVREWMGEPANMLDRYNPNDNERGKFYVTIKQENLSIIRDGVVRSQESSFVKILENKSGNCGEYEILTNVLARLKGFRVLTCVEDFGNDNHAYSIVKLGDNYYAIDAWKNEVENLRGSLPGANNPTFSVLTNQRKNPLPTDYFDTNLYETLCQEAVGQSLATSKLKDLKGKLKI